MQHPAPDRRLALQAGAVGLLGLAEWSLGTLRAADAAAPKHPLPFGKAKSVVFVFLSGGLSQIDSFDPKPDAAAEVRGEFAPTTTRTPGVRVCEHLPRLAACSDRWAMIRSLTHPSNNHSEGHHIMLTGRTPVPAGFSANAPGPNDWPSVASVVGSQRPARNNLPPAVVLPDRIVHNTGRTLPGQFGGLMGPARDPWFLELSAFEPAAYGAYPLYEFDHQQRPYKPRRPGFRLPDLSLPAEVGSERLADRLGLLRDIDRQRAAVDRAAEAGPLDEHRSRAASLLTDPKVRRAFDIARAEPAELDRYGRHSFGWSMLLARRLVDAGVSLVQVNLGNNETWDTHGNAFPHLKEKLLPPFDQSLTALLDDLHESGLLESTLVVVAGEFGRTPKVSTLSQFYKGPGRDHWGAVQTVLLAGGGVRGGAVVGSSDRNGGRPSTEPQTPENFAATIYHALGIPSDADWRDARGRPMPVYHGEPIAGLG